MRCATTLLAALLIAAAVAAADEPCSLFTLEFAGASPVTKFEVTRLESRDPRGRTASGEGALYLTNGNRFGFPVEWRLFRGKGRARLRVSARPDFRLDARFEDGEITRVRMTYLRKKGGKVRVKDPAAVTLTGTPGPNEWIRRIRGGYVIDPLPAFLPDGGLLLAGGFNATCELGRKESRETTLANFDQFFDAWLARYSPSGDLLWARVLDRSDRGWNPLSDLAAFPDGSSVAAGFRFVSRHDSDGHRLWLREHDLGITSMSPVVAALPEGECAFAASTGSSLELDRGTSEPFEFDPVANAGLVLVKYAPDGSRRWVRTMESSYAVMQNGIAGFPDGSLVLGLWYRGELVLDMGESLASSPSVQPLLVRFAPDGRFLWTATFSGSGNTVSTVSALPDGACVASGNMFGRGHSFFGGLEPNQTLLNSAGESIWIARPLGGRRLARLGEGGPRMPTLRDPRGRRPDGRLGLSDRICGHALEGGRQAGALGRDSRPLRPERNALEVQVGLADLRRAVPVGRWARGGRGGGRRG